MKHLKLIFACLLTAIFSIGQVWAASVALTQAEIKAATAQASYPSSEVNVSSESGTWHGKMIINTSTGFVQIRKNNANNYCGSPTFAGGVTQVVITTCNNTTSGRTFYLRANTETAQPTSGDYGSGSISEANGTATITVTGAPTSFYIYANGAAYISSITVTYSGSDPDPELQSIAISGTPTTTSYENGNAFDPTGLVVTGTYDIGDPATITSGITWTACKTESGTYVALDDEAVALAKDETGIYVKATVSEKTSAAFHVTGLTVTAATPKITIDGSAEGITATDENQNITAGVGSFAGKFKSYSGGVMFTSGTGYIYNTASFGYIRKITINYRSGGSASAVQWISLGSSVLDSYAQDITNGVKYESSTGGNSNTFVVDGDYEFFRISVSSKNLQASSIVIEYDNNASAPKAATPTFPTGDENFLTSTSVTLACETSGATIYYTTDGTAPTTSSSVYSAAIPVSATTTIKAMAAATGMDNSNVVEKTFTKGTKLTVAQAIALIPNKDDTQDNQFVEGYVCTAGTSVSSGQMTYYISDDGTETSRLQIFKGKNLNNTDFTATTNLSLQDKVIIFGQLKNYNNTPEMNSGNYIVERVPAAVAAPTFTPDGGGFLTTQSVALACNTDGAEIRYTTDGTDPTELSTLYSEPIELSATTTITAAAFKGGASSSAVARTFTKGTKITVAEALEALDSNNPIANQFVYGIVSTAPTSNPNSGRLTYYISDDGTATDQLEVFNGYGLNGASFTAKTDLQVGDEVTVFGNLKIYNETKEFDANNYLLEFNHPTYDVTGVTMESTASVAVGGTVTLHASVVPANASNKAINWSVQSGSSYASVADGVVTGIAEGTAVIRAASDEDASIYAECTVTVAPLSPWATVYTSNITLSTEGGTSASEAKVKFYGEEGDGYDALKAGTSGTAGAVVVNVPAGATALHFHAYSWNTEDVELTVTAPAGVTVAPSAAIAINKNSGISGNSPFTLEDGSTPQYDAYYAVSLSGNSEPIDLTISATSGKRFVLFGVNQVGGIALESIAISGTASNLEYNDGDHFNPAGLSVTGHYSNASTAPITEGIVWAYDPDPLTEGTTSVSVTATAAGKTSAAFVVNGLTVGSAAPLSPWASVYTSNVEIASSTAAHVTINGEDYDAAKTSKGASATITLPQGVTAIHLHLVAWNGEAQTVSVTGDCFNEAKELSIEANAGVSGSGTTYDLGESGTDYYFSLTPDNEVAANTVITIAAASGKRFVLFGVNQEGGVAPATLQSIAISGTASVLEYSDGQNFNPAGLVVTGTYSDASTAPISEGITWAFDPSPLTQGTTSVSVTATVGEINSPAFVVNGLTVGAAAAPTTDNVVILASFDNQLYAMSTSNSNSTFAAVMVEKDGSNIVVPSEEAKTAIQWTRATSGANTTFQNASEQYMKGTSGSTAMSLDANVCNWSWDGTKNCYVIGSRSFFYSNNNGFKNYGLVNAGKSTEGYSGLAEVRVIAAENIIVTSKANPQLAYNPTSVTLTVGGTFTPATLTYASGFDGLAAVTYVSSNPDLATIEGGVVSLVADATGSTTITASFPGNTNYLAGSASYTITVNEAGDDLSGTWTLVTDAATLADGKKVIIAQHVDADGAINTMAGQANNNRSVVASIVAGTTLTPAAGTKVMTLANAGEGKFYLKTSNDQYLYNASSSGSSYLRTKEGADDASWTIEVDAEGVATITSVENTNRTKMRYNPNTSGNPLFNCYTSGQSPIALYMQEEDTPEPAYTYETVRSGLEPGRHYTVCLKNNIVAVRGASFWRLYYRNAAGTEVFLEEEKAPLAAGTPFIFQATAENLEVAYGSDEVNTPVVPENSALRGTFDDLDIDALDALNAAGNIYILIQNAIRPIKTGANYLNAFRAYIDYDELTVGVPQKVSGRRVRSIPMEPMQPQVTTGINEIQVSDKPVKVMIDGQLFILRGDKRYDATGRLVE